MGCRPSKQPNVLVSLEVFVKYEIGMRIGGGATCQVYEAQNKGTSEDFAMKCIVKAEVLAQTQGEKDFKREVAIMRLVDHESICRLIEVFEDPEIIFFIHDFCQGESLFDKLEADIALEEQAAARICRQMTSAVAHVHGAGIIHRDLKPENWLYASYQQDSPVKLINFGLSAFCEPGDVLTTPCGTLHYVGPEVLKGGYNLPADIWTLGVVMFLVLYGGYPFDGECSATVMKAILGDEPDWSDSCYALSNECKEFLRYMLVKDPKQRTTAEDATNHEWFKMVDRAKTLPMRASVMSVAPLKSRPSHIRRESVALNKNVLKQLSVENGLESLDEEDEDPECPRLDTDPASEVSLPHQSLHVPDGGATVVRPT